MNGVSHKRAQMYVASRSLNDHGAFLQPALWPVYRRSFGQVRTSVVAADKLLSASAHHLITCVPLQALKPMPK